MNVSGILFVKQLVSLRGQLIVCSGRWALLGESTYKEEVPQKTSACFSQTAADTCLHQRRQRQIH